MINIPNDELPLLINYNFNFKNSINQNKKKEYKCIQTLYGHSDKIVSLYELNSKYLVSGSYDQTIKNTIILQKFLREQYDKKMKKDKERREKLLNEFVNKKIKNDSYKLRLPFNIWQKKVKLEKLNEAATKIQNNFRNNKRRKKRRRNR